MFGQGFITPFEFGLNAVYGGFLVLELIFGYIAAKRIVASQTTMFLAKFDEHVHSSPAA